MNGGNSGHVNNRHLNKSKYDEFVQNLILILDKRIKKTIIGNMIIKK